MTIEATSKDTVEITIKKTETREELVKLRELRVKNREGTYALHVKPIDDEIAVIDAKLDQMDAYE